MTGEFIQVVAKQNKALLSEVTWSLKKPLFMHFPYEIQPSKQSLAEAYRPFHPNYKCSEIARIFYMVSGPSRLGGVDNRSLVVAHALECAELDSPKEFAALRETHTQIRRIAYQTGSTLSDITGFSLAETLIEGSLAERKKVCEKLRQGPSQCVRQVLNMVPPYRHDLLWEMLADPILSENVPLKLLARSNILLSCYKDFEDVVQSLVSVYDDPGRFLCWPVSAEVQKSCFLLFFLDPTCLSLTP